MVVTLSYSLLNLWLLQLLFCASSYLEKILVELRAPPPDPDPAPKQCLEQVGPYDTKAQKLDEMSVNERKFR